MSGMEPRSRSATRRGIATALASPLATASNGDAQEDTRILRRATNKACAARPARHIGSAARAFTYEQPGEDRTGSRGDRARPATRSVRGGPRRPDRRTVGPGLRRRVGVEVRDQLAQDVVDRLPGRLLDRVLHREHAAPEHLAALRATARDVDLGEHVGAAAPVRDPQRDVRTHVEELVALQVEYQETAARILGPGGQPAERGLHVARLQRRIEHLAELHDPQVGGAGGAGAELVGVRARARRDRIARRRRGGQVRLTLVVEQVLWIILCHVVPDRAPGRQRERNRCINELLHRFPPVSLMVTRRFDRRPPPPAAAASMPQFAPCQKIAGAPIRWIVGSHTLYAYASDSAQATQGPPLAAAPRIYGT